LDYKSSKILILLKY